MANTYTLPGVLLTGTHAARPAANTVANGTIYNETDTGLIFQSNASAWSAWGTSALPAGTSVNYTGGDYTSKASTTFADLDATNLKLTVVTLARHVLIGVSCSAAITTATQTICLDVTIDGTREGQAFGIVAVDDTTTSKAVNMSFVHMTTSALTAASHEFRVQYRVSGSSASFYASTGVTPFGFWVQELPF